MKKVLFGLLALAVVSGGAFAQGWTFNGFVNSGLGVFMTENDDNVAVGPVSTQGGGILGEARVDARYTNAEGNAGMAMRLRWRPDAAVDANIGSENAVVPWAYGWLSYGDQLTLYGGYVDNGTFNTFDVLTDGIDNGEGLGLLAVIRPRPIENLVLGFGAFVDSRFMTINGDDSAGTFGTTSTGGINQAKASVLLEYTLPDLMVIRAGFRNANEVGSGPSDWSPLNLVAGGRTQSSHAYISMKYLALPDDMTAALTARFQNLETFGDDGDMAVYASFGHSGLVDNLNLGLNASVRMNMNDDADLHYWIMASAEYALSDTILPRLHLQYVTGGIVDNQLNTVNRTDDILGGVNFDKDCSFFRIQPAVRFKVTNSAYTELGGIVNFDLGDNETWGNGNGTNMALYALFSLSF